MEHTCQGVVSAVRREDCDSPLWQTLIYQNCSQGWYGTSPFGIKFQFFPFGFHQIVMNCDMEIYNLFQHHDVAFDERDVLRWNIGLFVSWLPFFLFAWHRLEQVQPQLTTLSSLHVILGTKYRVYSNVFKKLRHCHVVHRHGNMTAWIQLCAKKCGDLSLKTTVLKLVVMRQEELGHHPPVHRYCTKFFCNRILVWIKVIWHCHV